MLYTIKIMKELTTLAEINTFVTMLLNDKKQILDIKSEEHRERLLIIDVLSNAISGYKYLYYSDKYRVIKHMLDNEKVSKKQEAHLKKCLKRINSALDRCHKVDNDIRGDRRKIFEAQNKEHINTTFERSLNHMSSVIYEIIRLYLTKTDQINGSIIPSLLVECDKDAPVMKHFIGDKYYKVVY